MQANYKSLQISNNPLTFASNSQRKVVRTDDGVIHLVYESMGHVWYETSTDNGTSWSINNNGHPLDNGAGKLPSIDDYGNMIAIVFQQQNGNNYDIKAMVYSENQGNSILGVDSIIHSEVYDPYSINANPNISWSTIGIYIVTFERKQTISSSINGINYIYGIIGSYNNLGIIGTGWFTGTYFNSINTTISANISDDDTARFQVAWEENNKIKYCSLKIAENFPVTFSAVITPSNIAGFTYNNKPSIIALKQWDDSQQAYVSGARLTWIGSRSSVTVLPVLSDGGLSEAGGGGLIPGDGDEPDGDDDNGDPDFIGVNSAPSSIVSLVHKAAFADPSNTSMSWSFSDNVKCVNINNNVDPTPSSLNLYSVA